VRKTVNCVKRSTASNGQPRQRRAKVATKSSRYVTGIQYVLDAALLSR